ncbi:hypothetical protein [Nitratireductor soli]|uniref:hypothetical protein n=1 Tax=Nitratireductor soli TaxID=1670619 RepID=UPI00065DC148|nr:hypothetical protein [Nitratireductor soli]
MGGKSGGNEAELARKDEQARQQRIREGTNAINRTFDGGPAGTGALGAGATYDPNATYYNADGTVWRPSNPNAVTPGPAPQNSLGGIFGGGFISPPGNAAQPEDKTAPLARFLGGITGIPGIAGGAQKTPQQEFQELLKSGKLFSGVETRTGFDDSFFEGRRNSFLDYYAPQLEDQYSDAQKELTFALARGGNLNSSTRGEQVGDLQKLFDTNERSIADQALAHENQARTAVEDARGDLISMLNVTGDAEGAANSALTRASVLSKPAAYDPLGQLFVDFTAGLGTQAAQERAAAASGGGYKPRYDTGLFGNTGRVSVRA